MASKVKEPKLHSSTILKTIAELNPQANVKVTRDPKESVESTGNFDTDVDDLTTQLEAAIKQFLGEEEASLEDNEEDEAGPVKVDPKENIRAHAKKLRERKLKSDVYNKLLEGVDTSNALDDELSAEERAIVGDILNNVKKKTRNRAPNTDDPYLNELHKEEYDPIPFDEFETTRRLMGGDLGRYLHRMRQIGKRNGLTSIGKVMAQRDNDLLKDQDSINKFYQDYDKALDDEIKFMEMLSSGDYDIDELGKADRIEGIDDDYIDDPNFAILNRDPHELSDEELEEYMNKDKEWNELQREKDPDFYNNIDADEDWDTYYADRGYIRGKGVTNGMPNYVHWSDVTPENVDLRGFRVKGKKLSGYVPETGKPDPDLSDMAYDKVNAMKSKPEVEDEDEYDDIEEELGTRPQITAPFGTKEYKDQYKIQRGWQDTYDEKYYGDILQALFDVARENGMGNAGPGTFLGSLLNPLRGQDAVEQIKAFDEDYNSADNSMIQSTANSWAKKPFEYRLKKALQALDRLDLLHKDTDRTWTEEIMNRLSNDSLKSPLVIGARDVGSDRRIKRAMKRLVGRSIVVRPQPVKKHILSAVRGTI